MRCALTYAATRRSQVAKRCVHHKSGAGEPKLLAPALTIADPVAEDSTADARQ